MAASIPRVITIFGLILLSHACYSAYEHAKLSKPSFETSNLSPAQPLPLVGSTNLPPDVSLETVISVLLICVGLVAGAEMLRPISWNVWAGKVESEGASRSPYEGLEHRIGFIDIRAKRKEFADWVREQGELRKK